MSENVNDIVRTLQRSADLVKQWGSAKLPNGSILSEGLTLDGICLWNVVAVDLALYRVPRAISLAERRPSIGQKIWPYLSWAKHNSLSMMSSRYSTEGCRSWPQAPRCLLLGFSPYMSRDVLQPIADRLAAGKQIHPICLYDGRSTRGTALFGRNHEFQSIWQHWDNEVKARAEALRRGLRVSIEELQLMRALPGIIQDGPRSLWLHMKSIFKWLFWVYLPLLLRQLAIAHHILRQHRPIVIVSPDTADARCRLYCLLGRQLSIPTLELQFGMCGDDSVEWQFFAADRLAVWGEKAREIMLAHGVPAGRIVLTGSPRHDGLANVSEADVARTRAQLGVPRETAVAVFASTYHSKAYEALSNRELINSMKRAVFRAAEQIDGLCLLVKPHPLENVRETKQLAGKSRNILFAEQGGDIRDLIKISEAFVGFGSSATLDALIANRLTLCPSFPGWVWSDLFVESGATLVPRSADDVARSLRAVVDGSRERILAGLQPARERFLRRWVFSADGQAAARIQALAVQMARGK